MKRLLKTFCICVIALSLTACGAKQAELVGDWVLVDGESAFGSVLRFAEDGALYFAPALHSADNTKDIDTIFAQMLAYYEIAYHVNNKKTVELTVTMFSQTFQIDVSYTQNGDVLLFDGGTYRRIA